MADTSTDILRYVSVDEASQALDRLTSWEKDILDRVNRRVAAAESLETLLDFLAEATRPASPCDRISLAFVEEDGRRIVSHITRASYEPLLLKKGYAADLAGSSLEAILAEGRVRIINDLEQYLKLHPGSGSTRILVREGVRSSLTVPLVVDGRRVGVLFRSSQQAGAYVERHAAFQLATAERLGQAVEKAYRIEQLTAANRAYFEVLGFVTHELKSPLAGIVMDAQLITDGYLGEVPPKQRERLDRVIAKGQYLLGLVNEYLDLARIEGGEMKPAMRSDVALESEVIDPSVDIVRPQIDAKRMRLNRQIPADGIRVEVDPNLLKIVMVNLLSNAAKYGREEGEITIIASLNEGHLKVAVRNEGQGFPPEERSRLFRKFTRLNVPHLLKEKGTGVGLYTVWRIIQAHNGRVDAQSEPGQWAEFSFEIPEQVIVRK